MGEDINVPIICKSFNPADDNGWGEARHAIFLGRSGSGKTHAAKIMLALYLLSTRTMGAFIPDGKGDFIRPSGRDLNLRNFLEANGRNVQVIHIEDLRLENTDQLQELLSIENFQRLVAPSIAPDKWRLLLELTLEKFTDEDEKLIVEGDKAISQEDNLTKITSLWNRVLKRFTEGEKLIDIVDHVLIDGKIYFLNIDSYNTSVNVFILGTLYKRFRSRALNLYKSRQKYANAIVYVDEANRFIPQSPKDEKQKELQEKLIDGIKTTRQYGLAWWLADQRPSAISKDAFTQMGTFFFGKGMTAVADQTNMESVLGKDGCNVYSYVATMGGSPFVASGQFIGVGSSESVAVPMQFFKDWQTLADQNNKTLDACNLNGA